MDKFVLFAVLLTVGVIGFLLITNTLNQNQAGNNISLTPTIPPLNFPSPTIPAQATPTPQQLIQATKAIIKTDKGDITLELYPQEASRTVTNFAKKAQKGFYNNLIFHRVEDWVVQGGDPAGNGTGGGDMPTEINSKPFVKGSLGVARGGDIQISNDAQFFITKTDALHLNNQYTNFGMVTDGMDVVEKLAVGDKILGITVE